MDHTSTPWPTGPSNNTQDELATNPAFHTLIYPQDHSYPRLGDLEPWNPLHAGGIGGIGGIHFSASGQQSYGTTYRTQAPSESGTASSFPITHAAPDSAYESRPKDTASVPGDCATDQDSQSELGAVSGLSLQTSNENPGHAVLSLPRKQTCVPSQPTQEVSAPFLCRECRRTLNTKSEMKKHKERHDRPYYCTFPGCTRREGFGSSHDLGRHERSVHPDTLARDVTVYKCSRGCDPVKEWPRPDNFRAHLRRMHNVSDPNLETYATSRHRRHAPEVFTPHVLKGIGQHGEPQQEKNTTSFHGEPSGLDPLQNAEDRNTSSTGTYGPSGQLSVSREAEVACELSRGPQVNFAEDEELDLEMDGTPPREVPFTLELSHPSSGFLDLFLSESRTKPDVHPPDPKDVDMDAGLALDTHSGMQPHLKSSAEDSKEEDDTLASNNKVKTKGVQRHPRGRAISDKKKHACEECSRNFYRPSDLKKHVKRHVKPFGCTFPPCGKEFGSKSDWKRHENTQHHLKESWKCNLASAPGQDSDACQTVYSRRDQFTRHLVECHKIPEGPNLDAYVKGCKIEQRVGSHYWCGFCSRTIQIEPGDDPWAERFKHMDGHYSGGHVLHIRDWVDEPKSASDLASTSKAAKTRKLASIPEQRSLTKDFVWHCCDCGHNCSLTCLTEDCEDCYHKRCSDCPVSEISTMEQSTAS